MPSHPSVSRSLRSLRSLWPEFAERMSAATWRVSLRAEWSRFQRVSWFGGDAARGRSSLDGARSGGHAPTRMRLGHPAHASFGRKAKPRVSIAFLRAKERLLPTVPQLRDVAWCPRRYGPCGTRQAPNWHQSDREPVAEYAAPETGHWAPVSPLAALEAPSQTRYSPWENAARTGPGLVLCSRRRPSKDGGWARIHRTYVSGHIEHEEKHHGSFLRPVRASGRHLPDPD